MELRESESSVPNDRAREDIKEMRALLGNLNLDRDSTSAGSPNTVISSIGSPQSINQTLTQSHTSAMSADYAFQAQHHSVDTYDDMMS